MARKCRPRIYFFFAHIKGQTGKDGYGEEGLGIDTFGPRRHGRRKHPRGWTGYAIEKSERTQGKTGKKSDLGQFSWHEANVKQRASMKDLNNNNEKGVWCPSDVNMVTVMISCQGG